MNTSIIIVMIGCATLIALAAIVCDYLLGYKAEKNDANCYISKKIIKLHRNYIAGILSFAIIMLLTSKYGGPSNGIFEYLSFGSTITSLVLSIIAIFVTVQSSSDLYKQFTRIDNTTDIIKEASEHIKETLKKIEEAESRLVLTSSDICARMENIVEDQERIEQTTKHILDIQESQSPSIKDNSTDSKQYFVDTCSYIGLLSLYACALSKEKQVSFSLSKALVEKESYSLGFLIGSCSAQYVKFTTGDNNDLITCTAIQYNSSDLYTQIQNRIAQQDKPDFWIDSLNHVRDNFELPRYEK